MAIDLIAPAGTTPTKPTYISLILVCAAVAIVGRDQSEGPYRRLGDIRVRRKRHGVSRAGS